MNNKIEIRHAQAADKDFWFKLDKHLSLVEFERKVRDKQAYVLTFDGVPVGTLRYNLFWDNTPFCTMLYIDEKHRQSGFGRMLTAYWENEMKSLGYDWILVSTQVDESAQHFYRKLGYIDCGGLLAPDQPMELFMSKALGNRK